MKAIVLAGGNSTRLYDTSKIYDKHLFHLYDRPVICWSLKTLKDSGICDVILSINRHNSQMFTSFLGSGKDYGVRLTYVIQEEQKGIAYAVNSAKYLLENEDRFLVYLADNFFELPLDFKAMTGNEDCYLHVQPNDHPERYSVLDISRKPYKAYDKPTEHITNLVILGAYVFTPKFFDKFPEITPSIRNEYEMADVISKLDEITYTNYKGKWFDIGTNKDLLECSNWLSKRYDK